MEAAALALDKGISSGLNELITFVGFPTRRSTREISVSTAELFKGIKQILDDLLQRAIANRTGADFIRTREVLFPDYFKTISALSNLARVIVPAHALDRLVNESFSELEADLREQGLAKFGATARDQAVFTVWTLRKTTRLIAMISAAGPVPPEIKNEDAKIAAEFAITSRWSQFHLDCLIASMRFDKAVHPEVLTEICEGLRTAVNAYGLIRQGVDLRVPRAHTEISPYIWDEEEQELLESSMSDMESEDL
jgi:hypothetical protein